MNYDNGNNNGPLRRLQDGICHIDNHEFWPEEGCDDRCSQRIWLFKKDW